MIGIILFSLLLIFAGVAGYAMKYARKPQRRRQLLIDLGLQSDWSNENPTPFFKWGWRKKQEERVWAERIVRSAFEKAAAWLSPDDIVFFQRLCEDPQSTKNVTKEVIEKRVDEILNRSRQIIVCARHQIIETLKKIVTTPEESIRAYLRKKNIRVGAKASPAQYGRLRFRDWMNTAAREMIGLGAEGWNIQNEEGKPLFMMTGLDAVRFWASVCQSNFSSVSVGGIANEKQRIVSEIKGMSQSIFQDYVADIKAAHELISQIEQIAQNSITQSPIETPEQYGIIFCHWLYTPGILFSRESYKHVRDFFSVASISPSFKMLILEKLSPNFGSIHTAVQRFPTQVIFYGKHQEARQLAVSRYQTHLAIMRKALSSFIDLPKIPPGLLLITSGDIRFCRERLLEQNNLPSQEAKQSQKSDSDIPKEYLPHLIDTQKEYSLFERSIDENTAENAGWIVNVEIEDFITEEYAHLDKSEYKNYRSFQ